MGLNFGGIFVRTADRDAVVAAIKRHWEGVGAKPLASGVDPLSLDPLSVAKTGKLGYAVCPPAADQGGATWVGVYDSERYHGSGELARFLAKELDAQVVQFSFSGSVDMASMRVLSGKSRQPAWHASTSSWEKVEAAVGTLPYSALYYNKLRDESESDALDDFAIFGFQDMPFRKGEYRGPSDEERRQMGALADVGAAVAAGDIAAVRAAYDAEPEQRYEILSAVTEGGAAARPIVLAMADELLADPGAYWRVGEVAEAAFDAGDRALFDRACKLLGAHVSRLETKARQLAQDKQGDRAIEILRRVIAHESAPLTAFNTMAYALIYARELPADAPELLASCEAKGVAHSWIFHNTACVWVRLGDTERALAAVGGAVNAAYPDLAKMRTDPDLAPLFDDPRFAAAFDAKPAATIAELVVEKPYKGKTYVLQRPVLVFDFFLEPLGTHRVGPAIAALLESYMADIPPGALKSVRRNGPWKALAKGAITRELNKLKQAAKSDFITIDFRGETDDSGGAPTEYGLHVEVWGESDDFGDHDHVPAVTLWFPAAQAAGDVDTVAARFARYCAMVPVEAGGAGLRVELRKSDYAETWWESDLLERQLVRFLGSERHPWREWSAGAAAGAMWLTFLGDKLVKKLGGRDALAKAVAPAKLDAVPDRGVVIRASLRPSLGMGTKPDDLGALPQVAKAIAPVMLKQPDAREDPTAHYSRLFEVPLSPYENGPPVVPEAAAAQASAETERTPRPKPKAKPKVKVKVKAKAKAKVNAKAKAKAKPRRR